MFFIIIFLAAVAPSFCEATVDQVAERVTVELQEKLSEILSIGILDKMQSFLVKSDRLLPDLPDPLDLPNFGFLIEEGADISNEIFGELSICNASITGLSTLTDTLEPTGIRPLTFTYYLSIESLKFRGFYDAQLNIYEGDYIIRGSGPVRMDLDRLGVTVVISLNIFHRWNRIALDNLAINRLNFERVEIFGDNFLVNGELYDWDELNSKLKPTFDALWPGARPVVEETVTTEVNNVLSDCKVFDMLNEVFDCFTLRRNAGSRIQRGLNSIQMTTDDRICPAILNPTESTTESSTENLTKYNLVLMLTSATIMNYF